MDDPLLKQYLRRKRSSGDVFVNRNTLSTLEPVTPIIPKQRIADVRLLKDRTIFEKQQPKQITSPKMIKKCFS